jgi:hypothetical protein
MDEMLKLAGELQDDDDDDDDDDSVSSQDMGMVEITRQQSHQAQGDTIRIQPEGGRVWSPTHKNPNQTVLD